ncbi:S41 family peptidase [Psychroserpens sp.]|uniref:S41 family peptidase n=1 Tax=Psychroserpens sp. TaxID=2020870 RepID=UPI003C71E160
MKNQIKNRIVLISVVISCFSYVSFAQRMLSANELQKDADLLKKSLEHFHSGLYRYISPENFGKKFDDFENKLNEPLTYGEFYKLISQLLSEINCSHTKLNPYNQKKEVRENLFDRSVYFPFYFEIIDYSFVVTENASSQDLPRGSVITSINGVPSKEIILNLSSSTSSDGKGTMGHRIKSLEIDRFSGVEYPIFDLMFPLFYPLTNGVFEVEAINFSTNEKLSFVVPALAKDERTKKMEERYGKTPSYDDGWKFEILEDNIGYIRLAHFLTWQLSFKKEEFFKNAFKEMQKKQVKNLVIDIRNSGGGDSGVYLEIFKYLFDNDLICNFPKKSLIRNTEAKPELAKYIQTYDKSVEYIIQNGVPSNFYSESDSGEFIVNEGGNCKLGKPYKNNFEGNVFILVNSANTSASFAFAHYAKEYKIATLVGQETGGNVLGFNGGNFLFFYLPNSKFEFDIPLQAHYFSEKSIDSGVQPHYLITRTSADIGNGIDKEMEKVRELIKK